MEVVFDDNANGRQIVGGLWGGGGHLTSLILVEVFIFVAIAERVLWVVEGLPDIQTEQTCIC